MADNPPQVEPGEDAGPPRTRPGTPRWVKVLGLIALGIVLLVVILNLATGGGHGPGRHLGGESPAPYVSQQQRRS